MGSSVVDLCHLFGGFAESPFAVLIVGNGAVQLFGREIGPEDFGEVEFAVGALPEQEVAQSEFTAGSDEEFGVGHELRLECLPDGLLVDVLGLECSLGNTFGNVPHRVGDLPARGVRESQHHGHAGVGSGVSLTAFERPANKVGEWRAIADDPQANVVGHEEFFLKAVDDERHQRGDFSLGSAPVFGGEGVECEEPHPEVRCLFGDVSHGGGSFLVSERTIESAGFGPSPVAVHDDGDVLWNPFGIESGHRGVKLIGLVARGAFGREVVGDRDAEQTEVVLVSEEVALQSVRCVESVEPVGEREAHGPVESDVETGAELVFHAHTDRYPRSDRASGGGEGETEAHLQIGGEASVALVAGAVGVGEEVQLIERGEVENSARVAIETPGGAHAINVVGIEVLDAAGVSADEVHAHFGAQCHARVEEKAHRGSHRQVGVAEDGGVGVVEQRVHAQAGAPLFGEFLFFAGRCRQDAHGEE